MVRIDAEPPRVNPGGGPSRVCTDECDERGPVHIGAALDTMMAAIRWRRDSAEFQAKKARRHSRLRRSLGTRSSRERGNW